MSLVSDLLSTHNPLEGNRDSTLAIRKILGHGAVRSMTCRTDTYESIIEKLKRALNIRREHTHTEQELAFVQLMLDMLEAKMLVSVGELGYYSGRNNNAYTYVGFFLHREYTNTIVEYAHGDEDVFVYICDSAQELKMWANENASGEHVFDREKRKFFPIAVDVHDDKYLVTPTYYNAMILRYPHGDLELLARDTMKSISDDYIWIQVRARLIGASTTGVIAFLRGFMQLISSAKN